MHDGTEAVYGADRGQLFWGFGMLPSDEALKIFALGQTDQFGETWNPSWFPIFQDDQNGFFAVVIGPGGGCGEIVSFNFLDTPYNTFEHQNLEEWARTTVRRFQGGVYYGAEHGAIDADPRVVARHRREEAPTPCDVDALVAALASATKEPEWIDALSDLRRHLHPEAVGPLIEMLRNAGVGRRTYAVELLGSFSDPTAADALRAAAESDADELVRDYARVTLNMFDKSEEAGDTT